MWMSPRTVRDTQALLELLAEGVPALFTNDAKGLEAAKETAVAIEALFHAHVEPTLVGSRQWSWYTALTPAKKAIFRVMMTVIIRPAIERLGRGFCIELAWAARRYAANKRESEFFQTCVGAK